MVYLKAIFNLGLQNDVEKFQSFFLYVDYTAGGKYELVIVKLSTNTSF